MTSPHKSQIQELEQHIKTAEMIKSQGMAENNKEKTMIGEYLAQSWGLLVMVAERRI